MNWYYAEAGQQRGPVAEDELKRLVTQGVIRPETLVWNETLTQWQPWSTVAPAAEPAEPVTPPRMAPAVGDGAGDGRVRCGRCHQSFAPEETLEISGLRVCAACKPLWIQQVREGLVDASGRPTVAAPEGMLSEAEFLARDYTVDVVGSLNEAWGLMTRRWTVVWLGCVLVWVAFLGISAVLGVLQLIPFVGILTSIVSSLITAWVVAGQANLFVRERRGLPNEVGNGFAFIGPRMWDILLTYLPMAGAMIPVLVGALVLGVSSSFVVGSSPAQLGPLLAAPVGVGVLVVSVALLYIYVCFQFAPILALDKGYGWTSALSLSWRFVNRHFWQNLWLVVFGGILVMAGACVCLIGLLLTYPLGYGLRAVVYDRHFRDLAPQR